jgi:hypothetical protein
MFVINIITDLQQANLQSQLCLFYLGSKFLTITTSESKLLLKISQMIHRLAQHVPTAFCLEHGTF